MKQRKTVLGMLLCGALLGAACGSAPARHVRPFT